MKIEDPSGDADLDWLEDVWVVWMFFAIGTVRYGSYRALRLTAATTGHMVSVNLALAGIDPGSVSFGEVK